VNVSVLTRTAMTTAALMLAHQVSSKALRDAAFLSVWPATALPVMMMATAGLAVAVVPVFAKLLARFRPERVVVWGFVVSAVGHVIEWRVSIFEPWVVVVLYLHLGGLAAVLLSGFWSIVGERFDPKGARSSFGRIAAAGTVGGALGSVVAERAAAWFPPDAILLLLAVLHVACAIGLAVIGRQPVLLPTDERAIDGRQTWASLKHAPHVRALAALMVLTTAGAAILDYLLKWRASDAIGAGPNLLQFFAIFYGVIQVVSFGAQTATSGVVRRWGIGRTISALPAGISLASAVALIIPAWPVIVMLRGLETVLRGSLFRSGYELLFVPMDAAERRRIKTFLDVTCDRIGEAIGAGFVQLLLIGSSLFLTTELLAGVIVIALIAWSVSRRVDRLYLAVVERQLVRHPEGEPLVLTSEAGWTLVDGSSPVTSVHAVRERPPEPGPPVDPRVQVVADLRSGDRARVEAALARASEAERTHVAQAIELLAWDDVLASARAFLERAAPRHIGMIVDALADPDTDFAIRRRLPRLLTTAGTPRAVHGALIGLDDLRFEVRYQCGRTLDRLLQQDRSLTVDPARIMAAVDRELSVPVGVWQGHGLIDQPDDEVNDERGERRAQRNLEHVFSLLATILPREPLQVALRGLESDNPGLRGLAIEYLEQVLPKPMVVNLRTLIEAPPLQRP
jgi:AAA family ATP:ADP antiporter